MARATAGPVSSHFARQLHYVLNFRAARRRLRWDSGAGCFPTGPRSPWQREEFIFNVSTGRDAGVSRGCRAGAGPAEARSARNPPGQELLGARVAGDQPGGRRAPAPAPVRIGQTGASRPGPDCWTGAPPLRSELDRQERPCPRPRLFDRNDKITFQFGQFSLSFVF